MKKMRTGSELSAIALMSGGLDSTLAAALIKQLGIGVIGVHIHTLFDTDPRRAEHLSAAAIAIEVEVRPLHLEEEHLEVVRHPRHGYGVGMNPCIDCRIFMLNAARLFMEQEGAQFVITGEVLGQRPMSQNMQALELTAKESGLKDRLLRPLSAKLLPDSLPVKEGWIPRASLLSWSGRGRGEQIALAKKLGIEECPQPAGGCLLCERIYSARLGDAFSHLGKEEMSLQDFAILRYGRHFRLSDRVKVIIGRNEQENGILAGLADGRTMIEPTGTVGPLSLVEGATTTAELQLAAALAGRYCDNVDETPLEMRIVDNKRVTHLSVIPLSPEDPRISGWRITG
ncbi:MAG: hypothetical protein U9Q23_03620 [Candidatus Bipolaricaulota bacterium]|nr:hypothetical protein [Candidatus Bipolaricaulota bacterium]